MRVSENARTPSPSKIIFFLDNFLFPSLSIFAGRHASLSSNVIVKEDSLEKNSGFVDWDLIIHKLN